jgi:hypothetical protein
VRLLPEGRAEIIMPHVGRNPDEVENYEVYQSANPNVTQLQRSGAGWVYSMRHRDMPRHMMASWAFLQAELNPLGGFTFSYSTAEGRPVITMASNRELNLFIRILPLIHRDGLMARNDEFLTASPNHTSYGIPVPASVFRGWLDDPYGRTTNALYSELYNALTNQEWNHLLRGYLEHRISYETLEAQVLNVYDASAEASSEVHSDCGWALRPTPFTPHELEVLEAARSAALRPRYLTPAQQTEMDAQDMRDRRREGL